MASEDDFEMKLDKASPASSGNEESRRKLNIQFLSIHQEVACLQQLRAKNTSYLKNAHFKWTTNSDDDAYQLTNLLSHNYREGSLIFVCIMQATDSLTALLRFKRGFIYPGISAQKTMHNIAIRLNLVSIWKPESFELIGKDYDDRLFDERLAALDQEDNVLGCVGCMPGENMGLRPALHHPMQQLDSFFGSILAPGNGSRLALVDHRFTARMRYLTENMLRTFVTSPYGSDSTRSATDLCSDRAAGISMTISLLLGIPAMLMMQALSGSDINNSLCNFGAVAVGSGSFGAGRGPLRELSCRAFILEGVQSLPANSRSITPSQREIRVMKLPYGNYFKDMQNWRNQVLHNYEEECLRAIETKILTAKSDREKIKVFLIELVSSDTMQCLRGAFLFALGIVLKKYEIILAVDDIMAGLRCGHHLSVQLYGDSDNWPITPDLVCLGKAYGTGALIALFRSKPLSPFQKKMISTIKSSRGIVTNQFDQLHLCRLQELLRVTSQPGAMEHVRNMPSIIHEHFKQDLIDFQGSFIAGIGAMHFTNLRFGQCTELLVQFHRILPCMDSCQQDFAVLKPIGVFPEVMEGVSPDHAEAEHIISRLWPKVDNSGAKKRKAEAPLSPPPSQSCSQAAFPLSLPPPPQPLLLKAGVFWGPSTILPEPPRPAKPPRPASIQMVSQQAIAGRTRSATAAPGSPPAPLPSPSSQSCGEAGQKQGTQPADVPPRTPPRPAQPLLLDEAGVTWRLPVSTILPPLPRPASCRTGFGGAPHLTDTLPAQAQTAPSTPLLGSRT